MAAKIQLTVEANFKSAEDALKSLGDLTESEAKKVEKMRKKFTTNEIDKMMRANTRLGASITAVSGKMAGLQAQKKSLERKIKDLINAGFKPASKEVQTLKMRYLDLNKAIKKENDLLEKNNQIKKNTAKLNKNINKSLKYSALALAGVGALIVKNTFDMAKYGDELAKTSRRLGVTVEELQEFGFAAERQGVNQQQFLTAMEKLQRNIGDARAETGKLNQTLKRTNPSLLEAFKNTETMGQAFELAIDSMSKMNDQFDKASLATALFGRQGLKMLTVTEAGIDGFNELRAAMRGIGVITKEQAERSEVLVDKMTDLQTAWKFTRTQLADQLNPAMQELTQQITVQLKDIPRLTLIFEKWLPLIKGVGVALGVVSIALGVKMIKAAFLFFKATKIASLSAGVLVLAITGLATAIFLIMKDIDLWKALFLKSIAIVKVNWKLFAGFLGRVWDGVILNVKEKVLDWGFTIGKIFFKTAKTIASNLALPGTKMEEFANKMETGFTKFNSDTFAIRIGIINQQKEINKTFKSNLVNAAAVAKAEDEKFNKSVKLWNQRKADEKARHDITINNIKAEQKEIENSIAAQKRAREAQVKAQKEAAAAAEFKAYGESVGFLKTLGLTDADLYEIDVKMKMLELQFKGTTDYIIEEANRRIEAKAEANAKEIEMEKQLADSKMEILKGWTEAKKEADNLELMRSMNNIAVQDKAVEFAQRGIQQIMDLNEEAAGKSRKAAILQKALGSASATISGLVGFNRALEDPTPMPTWLRLANAFSLLGSSAVSVAKIWSTPLPTAETGGRFTVPDATGTDNVGLRVNPGETIDVTPRGEQPGGTPQKIVIQLNEDVLFEAMTNGVRQGKVIIDGNL